MITRLQRRAAGWQAKVLPGWLSLFAMSLTLASPSALAGQASAAVTVRVALVPAAERLLCKQSQGVGVFGAAVTLVCNTGQVAFLEAPAGYQGGPMHGGAYRYLLQFSNGKGAATTVDAQPGAGSIIGWQLMQSGQREYLELLLGW